MASVPPDTGLNFYLPWGVVEWAITGIVAAGAGVAAWVWRLGGKVAHLEEQNAMLNALVTELKGDHRQTQQMMRSLGGALDKKIDDQIGKIETRIDGVAEKIERVREELPSRAFIENQLNNLSLRIDSAIALRIAGREH